LPFLYIKRIAMNYVTGKEPLNKIKLHQLLTKYARPLKTSADLDPLLDLIGEAKYVLLGEASHGTHEYYTWRTHITKRLIAEKGFSFIAVEGDWPDCYRLNRYVKGYPEAGKTAHSVLNEFTRWPTWMWANWEVVALAEWLHKYNAKHPLNKRVGFYGLDLYSLWESIDAMVDYLRKTDPAMLKEAMKVVECFEPYGRDEGSAYASAAMSLSHSCENEVVNLLTQLRKQLPRYNTDHEAVFSAGQNALVIAHAEAYYRAMFRGGASTWNLRDRHMVETLNSLMKFHGDDAKVIVWEHNTHIGDARATDMKRDGMVNVGQLVHEAHHRDGVVRVGFGSYKGSVIAGREWGDSMKKLPVPAAMEGSFEDMLHEHVKRNSLLITRNLEEINFSHPIGHRAIGVVYNPEVERYGNYVPSVIPLRYEAFIYLDEMQALHPLHIAPHGHEIPDTYPWGV
jgi:erythromycin esterase-like protein